MKYLKRFNEELSSEEKAKRTAISNFPHIAKEESEKRERRIKRSQEEDPDGMYSRDDERYDDDSSSIGGWQDGMGKPSWLGEGRTEKASKEKDSDVKLDDFRTKVKDFLKGKDCKVNQIGDDFEVHCDNEHIAQVMFRKDKMTVKKEGAKFGKDFNYNQLGDVKKELTSLLK